MADLAAKSSHALATGPFGSAISSKFFESIGVPVIRGSNLSDTVNSRLIDDNLVFVSRVKANEFSRSIVRRGDLIFTCWGTVGQVGLIDERAQYHEYVISNKQMKLTPDPQVADSLFLYYVFSSPAVSDAIKSQAIGSSVPGFNLGQLKATRLRIPPLNDQRAIVAVLGALDDKIEQNRRTAQVLERLAQAIFQAWFVDFEPVKAKAAGATAFPSMPQPVFDALPTRLVDSDLGPVPEGWNVGRLGDIAVERRDGVQPADIDPQTPYIGLEHMPRHSITLTEWEHVGKVTSGKVRFREGQILFGKLRPYFHKVGLAPTDGVCSTDIVVMEPKESLWLGVVLGLVSSDAFVAHATACSTGTKMPRSNYRDMASYKIAIPPETIAASFAHIVRPMLALLTADNFEARKLAAVRDFLLPKLFSGEVRVEAD